jgi:hypothetical protein
MHFGTKSYLKSTRNHTAKHALSPIEKNIGFSDCGEIDGDLGERTS